MQVNKKGDICSRCNPRATTHSRVKEARIVGKLKEWADQSKIPPYTSWNKQNPLSDPIQCGRYRVDVNYDQPVFVVPFECDEDQHIHYDRMCEFVRQGKIALSHGGKPVRFIRYNPDGFKVAGMTRRTGSRERMCLLLQHLQENVFGDNSWIYQDEKQDSLNFMIVDYLFYDPVIPGSAGGLVQTFKFATLQEYEEWAEGLAPTSPEVTDDGPAMDEDDAGGTVDATTEDAGAMVDATTEDVGAMVDTTTEDPATTSSYYNNVSRWGRRLKLHGSARSHFYTFLLRIP